RLRARARRRAHTDAQWRRRAAREASVTRQEDAGDSGCAGMDQRRLRLEQRQDESAAIAHAERAVGIDRVDTKADLVQVRDDDDRPVALSGAHPQIARGVGFRARPGRQQTLHRGSHWRFHAGDAVTLYELGEDGLRFGDSARILSYKTARRHDCKQACRSCQRADMPTCDLHWPPPIHFSTSATSASTSRSPTVSTVVSMNLDGTVTKRVSANGPCVFTIVLRPAVSA